MSKAKYVEPTMEIIQLETVDIITTSTGSFYGDWIPINPTDNEENNEFLIH